MSRNFTIKYYPSVRAVCHQMVLRAPSGLSARDIWDAAGYTNYNTMMSELSRQPGHKLGADMLLPLMDVCDSDAPLKFLARERDGIFLKIPQPAECGGELLSGLAATIREFGEFAATAAEHISDGEVNREEMARIDKETGDVVEAVLAFRKLARVTHEAGCGKGRK
ncbi:hypothetical protein LJC47_03075 [Desulfosarcina sp. OttesenSCG-928-B08]|nr:hypothetical protein [Desulfosarcina sp. OttesenSCG-928-B08]